MDYKIVKMNSFFVVGIATRTDNKFGKSVEDVSILWHEYFENNVAPKIKSKLHENPIALYTEYEDDAEGSYTAVVGHAVSQIDDLPDGVDAFFVPASSYAEFHVKGSMPKAIVNAWKEIKNTDIKRLQSGDYEIYTGITSESTHIDAKIYVAVE